jgi:phosphoglycerate-specific signal transduction histidine kinase
LLNGATYIHPLIPIWNGVMLLVFFIVVVWLLTEFQRSHEHLEQIVDARTAALRAEIDERKRLEQAKLQAERLAMVGSMASRMAHEIRNPLGAMSLNLDSVREELNTAASAGQFSGECQTLLREMRAQILRIPSGPSGLSSLRAYAKRTTRRFVAQRVAARENQVCPAVAGRERSGIADRFRF